MRHLIIVIFISVSTFQAQDSLSKMRFGIFDCEWFIAPTPFFQSPNTNLDYISKFTDRDLVTESAGYSEGYRYYSTNSTTGINFGANLNFKIINPKYPFYKRVKPRISVQGAEVYFFDEDYSFSNKNTIDTLFYVNPDKAPLIIDSTTYGHLNYSYTSKMIFLELGLNVDLLTFRYFNFYTGAFIGEGFSIVNEFITTKEEHYRISAYPGQTYGAEGDLIKYTQTEKGVASVTRLSIALGVQHRFSNRRKGSIGLFGEVKPGLEFYKFKNKLNLTQKMIMVSLGIRYSFCRHK
jgi:hypothetical protein